MKCLELKAQDGTWKHRCWVPSWSQPGVTKLAWPKFSGQIAQTGEGRMENRQLLFG